MAVSNDQKVELGFDRPLSWEEALSADTLGRRGYAEAAVHALGRVNSTAGFVLSVEGAWGSGKTSTLAMMEALLRAQEPAPVIVHFNPWLIGDRDALLRHFLSKIAAEVNLADHAADGKKVAREIKACGKVFDFIRLVPGAEPWASLVKTVIESAGEAVDSVTSYKTRDVEARKKKVEEALRHFGRAIIVFIDDIDRLFPLEVFEMIRIVKAVGDLQNVGYVLAWDPEYVSDALKAADVPRSETYLDKVVQVRLPLPAIGLEARRVLINKALSRLHPDADKASFANAQGRLQMLYFSGLREMLEQPRDYARVFNTVAVIEPTLRGEVVLADIIGLAALMVRAPRIYDAHAQGATMVRWAASRRPGSQGDRGSPQRGSGASRYGVRPVWSSECRPRVGASPLPAYGACGQRVHVRACARCRGAHRRASATACGASTPCQRCRRQFRRGASLPDARRPERPDCELTDAAELPRVPGVPR
jgi:predicted KAP-like P-loop ATPase